MRQPAPQERVREVDFWNYTLHMKSDEVRNRRSHLNKPQYPEQPPQFLVESCCSTEIS